MTAHARLAARAIPDLKDASLLVSQAYVAGEWIDAPDGKTIPGDRSVRWRGHHASARPRSGSRPPRDRQGARGAEGSGPSAPPRSAAQILRKWYDLILANADDLALILTTEQGKPLAEAKGEVISNAAYIEWFAEEAKRIDGDIIPRRQSRPADHGAEAARGRVRGHHPVELSQWDDHAQGRPGAGGRLHHGAQARSADAAVGSGARRAGRAGRGAEGRILRDHRSEPSPSVRSSATTRKWPRSPSRARPAWAAGS